MAGASGSATRSRLGSTRTRDLSDFWYGHMAPPATAGQDTELNTIGYKKVVYGVLNDEAVQTELACVSNSR